MLSQKAISPTTLPDVSRIKQRKRMHSVSDGENDENTCPTNQKVPKKRGKRPSSRIMPSVLNESCEFGSPSKFWSSLCERDNYLHDSYERDSKYALNIPAVNMRVRFTVFEWLMNVFEELKLHRESFHLTMDFFDRYLTKVGKSKKPENELNQDNLQLLAVACLFVAVKIEEVYPPKLGELVEYGAGTFTDEDLRRTEESVLQKLEWHCSPMTAIQWLSFYLQMISKQDVEFGRVEDNTSTLEPCTSQSTLDFSTSHNETMPGFLNDSYGAGHVTMGRQFSVPKLMRDDFFSLSKILDLCMGDVQYLNYTYSQIAAAVVMISYEPTEKVEQLTGFTCKELREVIFFVEPFAKVLRNEVSPGVSLPHFRGVESGDQHNIQTSSENISSLFDSAKRVADERKEFLLKKTIH